MADFVKVATVEQVPIGQMIGAKAGDVDVLVSNIDGKYYAIHGLCTHREGVLSKGRLEGKIVTCPRHGSMFDVTTGKSISGPKVLGMRMKTDDEPAYEVRVEGKDILVKIG